MKRLRYYADSSFLVSCYLLDANTSVASKYLVALKEPLPFTALHQIEVRNAMMLSVFRGIIAADDIAKAWKQVQLDIRRGLLVRTDLSWDTVFRYGTRLSSGFSAVIGTRSLNILHVAAAASIRAKHIVTFDTRQRALALRAGFHVAP